MSKQLNYFTRATGVPVSNPSHSLTAGPHGPVLMQDIDLVEKIQYFAREKIPARNVHALGSGCYGTFTATNSDISKYTMAKVFEKGTKTDLFVRMSGIFTEQGDPETFRDPRGFSIKFYTTEGNWDLMAINTPVFNARDMKVGPDGVHAFKRDPKTGLWNPAQTWDFINNHPEALLQTLMIYSDEQGTPASYRHMNAYGCNTFSFVNKDGVRSWVKFHLVSEQGVKGFTVEEAKLIAGEDPNFLSHDLYNSIEKGEFPRWKLAVQIMPENEGYEKSWAFDCTKMWSLKDYPLVDLGIVELNRNPENYFTEVEQVAFSPANVVPGIGFSPDKLLQGRLLLYDDTQTHRIGPNYKQLKVNMPRCPVHTIYYGGNHQMDDSNKFPLYNPSAYKKVEPFTKSFDTPFKCDGPAGYYTYPYEGKDEDFYDQPRIFFDSMDDRMKMNLSKNIAVSLLTVPTEIVDKLLFHLNKISRTLGNNVQQILRDKRNSTNLTEGERLCEKLASSSLNPATA